MTNTRSHDDKKQCLDTIWRALHLHRENSTRIGISEHDQEWLGICKAMALVTEELGLEQAPAADNLITSSDRDEQSIDFDVRVWRNSRKLTQERAAELLGVSYRQYQRIEAGHSKLSGSITRLLHLV